MIQILINGKQVVNITRPVGRVYGMNVMSFGHKEIRRTAEVKLIADFVYECVQKCEGIVMFNNAIIPKEEVNKPIYKEYK